MTKVVLIHWGDNEYVRLAEKQAKRYNDVELILDILPKPKSMEIDRWFVLNDYMSRKGLDRVVYIDSDVLLLKDVSEDFVSCDFALSMSHSGHTMFVNNAEALDDFCLYIQQNRNDLSLIEKTRKRLYGYMFPDTMGDMVLLNNFVWDRVGKYQIGEVCQIRNKSIYDHNFNMGEYIKGIDGRVYTAYEDSFLTMNSLHFQGAAKGRMKEWAEIYSDL